MSKVNKQTVEYVAKLARISLTESEKEPLIEQLSKILDYIDKLKGLDTDKVEPLRNLHEAHDVLREDVARPSVCRDEILDNTPVSQNNYLKIPRVID